VDTLCGQSISEIFKFQEPFGKEHESDETTLGFRYAHAIYPEGATLQRAEQASKHSATPLRAQCRRSIPLAMSVLSAPTTDDETRTHGLMWA
jgi:hypothetical protein